MNKKMRILIYSLLIMGVGAGYLMIEPDFKAQAQDNEGIKTDLISPQDANFKDELNDVAKELRCPTCTGLSVLESTTPFSNQIKDEVAAQISQGKSKDEILKYFVSSYGPWILRAPPMEGVNILVWLFPILLLTVGPLLIYVFVWRKKGGSSTTKEVGEMRTAEEILTEMHNALNELKKGVKNS